MIASCQESWAHELIDERFAHLPAAHAVLESLRVIAAQPPEHWEDGLQDIAERLPLPVTVLRTALADLVTAWNEDPHACGQVGVGGIRDVKNRLASQAEHGVREHVTQSASATARQERRRVTQPQRPDRRATLDV